MEFMVFPLFFLAMLRCVFDILALGLWVPCLLSTVMLLASLQNVKSLSNHEEHDNTDQESSPFSWTRSPEKLFWQETYLALASAFVLLRLLHFIFPALHVGALYIWRRNIRNISLGTLLEYPQAYLKGAMQLLNSLKEPQKRRNLQGTLNARAWASSLASVSIGDAGSSRFASVSEQH